MNNCFKKQRPDSPTNRIQPSSQDEGLWRDDAPDPAQALSRLRQADTDYKITDHVMTPFDTTKLTQTLNVPHRAGEVITVRFVTENVQDLANYNENQASKETRFMKCCDKIMTPSVKKTSDFQKRKCTECSSILDQKCDAAFFECREKSSDIDIEGNKIHKMVCAKCFNEFFTRKSLEMKTNKHAYFQHYHFDDKNENEPIEQIFKSPTRTL